MNTCAKYIDEYGVKIAILPSTFKRCHSRTTKRAQFHTYGQPTIRNRVVQFLVGKTFITGAPDAAIYGENYPRTDAELRRFDELARERGKQGEYTAGFMPIYTAKAEKIHLGNEAGATTTNWKNRINHFPMSFSYTGEATHDMEISVFKDGRWSNATPKSGHYNKIDFTDEGHIKLDLRIIHYNAMFRPDRDSTDFIPSGRKNMRGWEEHPKHYIEKLVPK